ncbi:MAG: hypothetical protein K2O57_02510, partial [Acetatifactor sp.]|nr:hypothetical protein [Acetatifactor sp.]
MDKVKRYIGLGILLLMTGCSLLLCACGQEMEPPQDNAVTLSGTVTETKETAETEKITAENADETLALLIEDKGFRERVRYGTDIVEEDSPEIVLQKLNNCESIVLREASYGNAIYSLESLSLLPNLKRLVIDIDQWDDSVIADFTPIAQLSQLKELYISYS